MHWNIRTELLLGAEGLEKLAKSHVLVCGLGGVGAAAAEMVARAGVGRMTILDADHVEATNRNRQLVALSSTEGQLKAEVLKKRLLDINPSLQVHAIARYLDEQTRMEVLAQPFDFVIDAIDTLSPKIFLIKHCHEQGLPFVSSMGAGGKMDPNLVQVADFAKTHHCRLAFYLRKKLKRWGIRKGFPVVFSPEPVAGEGPVEVDGLRNKKSVIGTISYMPVIFGCFCASVALRALGQE